MANLERSERRLPPNASPGTGSATALFDLANHTLDLHVTFSGLTSRNQCSTHPCTHSLSVRRLRLVSRPRYRFSTAFQLVSPAAAPDRTFDASDSSFYNPDFITNKRRNRCAAAEAAFASALADGRAYLNIRCGELSRKEKFAAFCSPLTLPLQLSVSASALIGLGMFRRKFRKQLPGAVLQ